MCSVKATGTATVSASALPVTLSCTVEMIRVKNTARYVLHLADQPFASLYIRPDVEKGKGQTYLDCIQLGGCIDRDALLLDNYVYRNKLQAYSSSVDHLSARMYFDADNKLAGEAFTIEIYDPDTKKVTGVVNFVANYTDVDYAYVHEEVDALFSMKQHCYADDESTTNATLAITSEQCTAGSGSTSGSTSSVKPTTSSSSAASFVLPSAILLLIAVVLAL